MIKFREVGMFATAKNDPTVKAHADIANGYLCGVASGKTVALTSTTAKTAELKLALLHHDWKEYAPATIKKDALVTVFDVAAWAGQNLIVTTDHLDLTTSYANLAAGAIFVAEAGKFKEANAATGYNIWFTLEAKTTLNGKEALDLRVHLASAATVVAST